jgi:hypothetical protein
MLILECQRNFRYDLIWNSIAFITRIFTQEEDTKAFYNCGFIIKNATEIFCVFLINHIPSEEFKYKLSGFIYIYRMSFVIICTIFSYLKYIKQ